MFYYYFFFVMSQKVKGSIPATARKQYLCLFFVSKSSVLMFNSQVLSYFGDIGQSVFMARKEWPWVPWYRKEEIRPDLMQEISTENLR